MKTVKDPSDKVRAHTIKIRPSEMAKLKAKAEEMDTTIRSLILTAVGI